MNKQPINLLYCIVMYKLFRSRKYTNTKFLTNFFVNSAVSRLFQRIKDKMTIYDLYLTTFKHFLTIFQQFFQFFQIMVNPHTNFWPILDLFLTKFWPISDQFLTNFSNFFQIMVNPETLWFGIPAQIGWKSLTKMRIIQVSFEFFERFWGHAGRSKAL